MEKFDLEKENKILEVIQANFGIEVFTPGLSRTRPLYSKFIENIKRKEIKIITVAGTNGKGQTCHTLSYLLKQNKKNVALWTSPHILSIRERFEFNLVQISYSELEKLIEEALIEIDQLNFKVSFYEFLFFLFLKWIDNKKIDFLILEVGLGGRLDAVNHFDCNLAVITSISRDHQAILGNSYKKILHEKLGITRKSVPLLTAFHLNYLIEETEMYCLENKIPFNNFKFFGDYFNRNIELAKKCLKFFGMEVENNLIPKFKGREEVFEKNGNNFIFIGSHNPDGVRELKNSLKKKGDAPHFILISFSKRDQSDLLSMLKTIGDGFSGQSEIILTYFDHPKAISREILEDVLGPLCHNYKIKINLDWKQFLNGFKGRSSGKKILVAGSYYFIGEVQRHLLSIHE